MFVRSRADSEISWPRPSAEEGEALEDFIAWPGRRNSHPRGSTSVVYRVET